MVRRIGAALFVLVLLFQAPAFAQMVTGSRLAVGPNPTPPAGSSVRITGLGTSGGTDVLVADAEGDITRRLLAVGDIPSAFTRRDIAEAISGAWTFNGQVSTNTFMLRANAGVQALHIRGTSDPFSIMTTDGATRFQVNNADHLTSQSGGAVNWLNYYSVGATADAKRWRIGQQTSNWFALEQLNDAYTAGTTAFSVGGLSGVPTAFTYGPAVNLVRPQTALYTSLGSYSYPYNTLHVGELRASTFAVNETQVYTEASLKVGRGSTLTRPLSTSTTTVFTKTKFSRYPDFLILRGLSATGQPQFEVMQMVSAQSADCTGAVQPFPSICGSDNPATPTVDERDNDDYAFSVARNQDGSGSNDWLPGSPIVSMDRWLDLFSDGPGVVTYGATVLADRPVLYYTFDDNQSTTPNQGSGYKGYTGARTPATAAANVVGYVGCYSAGCQGNTSGYGSWVSINTGVGAYNVINPITAPELAGAAINYAFSLEMVFYTGDLTKIGYAVHPMSRWDQSVNNANFVLYFFGDGVNSMSVHGNCNGFRQITPATPALNGWYHVLFTWDADSGGATYLNGALIGRSPDTASPIGCNGQGQPFRMTTNYNFYVGEAAVYDYALQPEQVAAHWQALHANRSGSINGPTAAGWVTTDVNNANGPNDWFDQAPRWAVGNLQGMYDYTAEAYGLAAGDYRGTWVSADAQNGFRVKQGTLPRFAANASEVIMGEYATVGKPYMQLTADTMYLCIAGVACNLRMDSGGNVSQFGNLNINGYINMYGGSYIESANNFRLGGSQGLTFQRWSGGSAEGGRSIRFVDTLAAGTILGEIGIGSGNAIQINSRSSGPGTGIRMALGGYAVGNIEPGLFITNEDLTYGRTLNIVAQSAASSMGQGLAIQFVPLFGSLSAPNTYAFIGTAANKWTHGYFVGLWADNYYTGAGQPGTTLTVFVRRHDDSGSCTLTFVSGLLVATTCAT